MKIGLDLHGVISDHSEYFRKISWTLTQLGFEVHIITGGSKEKALEELKSLNFMQSRDYTHLFSVLDYHISRGTRITGWHPVLKNPEFPDIEWDKTKADYCRLHGIGLHLDDSVIYEKYFTTPFARVFTNTGTPKIDKPLRHLE